MLNYHIYYRIKNKTELRYMTDIRCEEIHEKLAEIKKESKVGE